MVEDEGFKLWTFLLEALESVGWITRLLART